MIAGGSGFPGVSLARHLSELGAQVVILSRNAPRASGPWTHTAWDGRTVGPWKQVFDQSAGVINLAGRSVDCIKPPQNCDEILRSRVESTCVLGAALRQVDSPPPIWVQMSTAHIDGDPATAVCTENSSPGLGLAPFVGESWERAFSESVLPTQRSVILRTSFVLGRDQGAGMGALSRLLPVVRFGLGGRVGSGRQGMSWIHEQDMNRLFERALTHRDMQGIDIASSPAPVSQVRFMQTMRRVMGVPIGPPATALMVRIGARLLLRTDPELALYGRDVVSERLQQEDFEFSHPPLEHALRDLLQ